MYSPKLVSFTSFIWFNFRIVDRWFIYLPKMIFSPFSALLISIGPFACAQYSILLFYVTQDYASLLLRTVYNGIIEKQLPASLCKRSQKWSIYPPIRLAQFTRTLSPNGFFLSVLSGDFLLYLRWLHQLTLRCNKFSSFFFIANGLTMTMMINGVCVCVLITTVAIQAPHSCPAAAFRPFFISWGIISFIEFLVYRHAHAFSLSLALNTRFFR